MTTRLYYDDAALLDFQATVTGVTPGATAGQWAVRLDRTAFYPTSGGQPHDLGTLGAATVLDVVDDEETGDVVHVVDTMLAAGATVRGVIDRVRRLDHMQQHTGQHVLSAAFEHRHQARTVSFHMGAQSSTIDLAREVTPAEIAAAERAANEVVFANLAVAVRYVTDAEAAALPLRKESARTGTLRLVEVPGFDLSACGGTHVAATGQIGLIAVSGWERFKGGSRVSFVCGWRALAAHGALRDVTQTAARALSIGVTELPDAIVRLQTDLKDRQRQVKQLQEQVTAQLGTDLRAGAVPGAGGLRVVLSHQAGWDAAGIKSLAQAVVSAPGLVVVLTGEGSPTPVVVARSADVGSVDAGAWIKEATSILGGRGGGRPEMAQGGVTASTADVRAFAERTLGTVTN